MALESSLFTYMIHGTLQHDSGVLHFDVDHDPYNANVAGGTVVRSITTNVSAWSVEVWVNDLLYSDHRVIWSKIGMPKPDVSMYAKAERAMARNNALVKFLTGAEPATEPAMASEPESMPEPEPEPQSVATTDPQSVTIDFDDDGKQEMRDMFGLTREALSALFESAVDVKVKEALRSVRPTVVTVGERPTVEVRGRTHANFQRVLDMLQSGVMPYLWGEAGTGKTYLADQLAEALGLGSSAHMTYGAMSMPEEIKGYRDASGEFVPTEAYEIITDPQGGLLLHDEIDRATPAMGTALNAILNAKKGGHFSFACGKIPVPDKFYQIGAGNTLAQGADMTYTAATQLDASTFDRFMPIKHDYDTELELSLAEDIAGDQGVQWCEMVHAMRTNAREAGLGFPVSIRAVSDGASMIANAGWTFRECAESKFLPHSNHWDKLFAGIKLGN